MTSPEFKQLVALIEASRDSRSEVTVDLYRSRMDRVEQEFPLGSDVASLAVSARGVPCEWVVCGEPRDDSVLLYLHGGCYVFGSGASIREFASRIAREGEFRVLTVDYRLAPEHPFPAAIDDVVTAYEWLVDQVGADKIVVAGESAGGGLTVALLVALRDRGAPLPCAAVPISPWVDLTLAHASLTQNEATDPLAQRAGLVMGAAAYLGDSEAKHPLASPLFADLTGLPPMLVQVGTGEILLDDALALARALGDAGVDVDLRSHDQMFHVWQYFGQRLPEGRVATEEIAGLAREHLGRTAT